MQSPPAWLIAALGGEKSASGVAVDPDSALTSTAVLAAVRLLSDTVSFLPFKLFRRLQPRGKEAVPDHPVYRVLHDQANEGMTAFQWRELSMTSLLLRGNAVSFIDRDNSNTVRGLWPIQWQNLRLRRVEGEVVYIWDPGGVEGRTFRREEVLHLKGFSTSSLGGLSPVGLWREAVGSSLAQEEFAARFFANGAKPSGVVEHPKELSKPARDNLKVSFDAAHTGLSNAQKTLILEEGMTYKSVGMSLDDAQFIESRKFSVTEVARAFGVPPHKIGDLDRATFSNIEDQNRDYVTYSLQAWLTRIEQSISTDVLTESERRVFFAEFLVTALLRGDTTARWAAYVQGRTAGVLSANDIRELESLNPIENGDIYLQPLNMVEAGTEPEPPTLPPALPPPSPPPSEDDERSLAGLELRARRAALVRRRIGKAFRRLFEDEARRILRGERRDVMAEATRRLGERADGSSPELLVGWLDNFYEVDHRAFIMRTIRPVFRTYQESIASTALEEIADVGSDALEAEFADVLSVTFAERWVQRSRGQLRDVLRKTVDPIADLTTRFAEWELRRPGKVALEETIGAGAAVAREAWKRGGVTRLRWVAVGENCPQCSSLNGKVVGIEGVFIEGEDSISRRPTVHPPLHEGCDCMIVPEA